MMLATENYTKTAKTLQRRLHGLLPNFRHCPVAGALPVAFSRFLVIVPETTPHRGTRSSKIVCLIGTQYADFIEAGGHRLECPREVLHQLG
jgi:hypothetical protein